VRRVADLGVVSFVLILSIAAATNAHAQAFATVKGKEPIPRGAFKTWSLFLVTNQDWLIPENASRLRQLYERSQAFGRVIGNDHLAVWFWKKDAPVDTATMAANVDVERAIAYCQKLGLKPSGGPYFVFTTSYPDETAAPESFSVIELNTDAEQIGRLLGMMGDQLVKEGLIRDRTFQQAPGSDDFWSAWFDATRHALSNLGSNFHFAIRTPTISIESGRKSGGQLH
jgi:hypothetical protein